VDLSETLMVRAARHAALGDPARLAVVDELAVSDRSPTELRRMLGMETNLLTHHLDVLAAGGLIVRLPSNGDKRRRYVHLVRDSLEGIMAVHRPRPSRALFVCRANSARSQMAAVLWRQITNEPAESAGTHPADRVHPGAVAAAGRAGLDIGSATPGRLADIGVLPRLRVTVCDQAHEEMGDREDWLHWSVPDPVPVGTRAAFDAALAEIRDRMHQLLGSHRAAGDRLTVEPTGRAGPAGVRSSAGGDATPGGSTSDG
jgi:protein-tyrosine-phosphatase